MSHYIFVTLHTDTNSPSSGSILSLAAAAFLLDDEPHSTTHRTPVDSIQINMQQRPGRLNRMMDLLDPSPAMRETIFRSPPAVPAVEGMTQFATFVEKFKVGIKRPHLIVMDIQDAAFLAEYQSEFYGGRLFMGEPILRSTLMWAFQGGSYTGFRGGLTFCPAVMEGTGGFLDSDACTHKEQVILGGIASMNIIKRVVPCRQTPEIRGHLDNLKSMARECKIPKMIQVSPVIEQCRKD